MRIITLLAASAAGTLAVGSTAVSAAPGDRIAGSYICVFKAGSAGAANPRAEAARAAGGSVRHVYSHSIRGFSASMSATAVQQMRAHNPNIAYCEQDQEMGLPPLRMSAPPSGGQPAQSTPWGVTRVHGGSGFATGAAWVIDTGIDLDHPDLNVDVARSRNFVSRETSPDDLNGHGSHVAGIIGALNNSIGSIGVTPGTTVIAVRVLNRRGSGSNSDVIAGVDYVAGAGQAGDVANMSLGGGVSTALDTAVVNAASRGVKFALAAGNESESATLHSPGRANGTNVYTVSAFGRVDTWASYSNYGNPPIDWAEPGSSIYSTYKDGGYATLSGTSMATPHLAGILVGGGGHQEGTVANDPDGNPDRIGVK